jgi:AraC-like DNA-binding protein
VHKFSFTERVSLNWLKVILCGLGCVWVIVILANVGNIPIIVEENLTDDIIYISLSVAVFFIGIYGIKQQAILRNVPVGKPKQVKQKSKHEQKALRVDSEKEILELIRYMEDEKPYLNPELNIGDLANSIGVHSHQLSKLINNQLGKNFFEFVNDFRVQEFKRNVTDPKNRHISILGVAMDSGFNSKATFNRIFKNSTGQTPSQFKESFKF